MFRNHALLIQFKKKLQCKISHIQGIIKLTIHGLGFVTVQPKKKYFIAIEHMKKVMNGDHIIAKMYSKNNQYIVEPEKLIKPILKIFLGTIKKIDGYFFIRPKYPFFKIFIICNFSNYLISNMQDGNWFIAQLEEHKLQGSQYFRAKLIKYISISNNILSPCTIMLLNHNLEYQAPDMNFNEIFFEHTVPRKDLTNLAFITIDHISTKDIDDALFIKKELNNYISLIIAIADPTAYIPVGSHFDIIASKRLFTNYLPGLNIPMLPRELSENLCSLHPNCKRPVLACKVLIDPDGNISDKMHFFLAWIKSHAKLTYENVSNWIEKKGHWIPDTTKIVNQITLLHELCQIRITWRKKYAVMFKDQLEYKFIFSNNKEILNIYIDNKSIAHKMIEEAMIIANVSAAKFLSRQLGFGIYNVHAGFDKKHAQYVSAILNNYGIYMNAKDIISLTGFCKLRRILNTLPNVYIENRIRKYQSFGEMSLTPKPHFALGFSEYATWTSPIRKYSDMMNHRFLKNLITGRQSDKPDNTFLLKIMDRKRRYRMIYRDMKDWLYINFLKQPNNKNKIFHATIYDIIRSGMRARLLENGANIFIPSVFLHNVPEELICNQETGLVFIKGKELYRISDCIKVSIIDIKLEIHSIIAKPV